MRLSETITFLEVVDKGSFTAASDALGLPRSTVSRHIKDLEATLGVQLLRRTTRRLGLTEAGRTYYDRTRTIPDLLAGARSQVAETHGEPTGTLRITAPFMLLIELAGPILPAFQQRHPQVRLDLMATHRTLDLVEQGIDVALRLGPLPDSSMISRRLGVLPNRVWASPRYLERHGSPSHPSELKDHTTLVTRVARRRNGHVWEMQRDAEFREFIVTPAVEADDPELLVPSLLGGSGLMMATDMVMRRHIAEGAVVPILPGWLGRCPALHAVFPHGEIMPMKLRAFLDFLVEHLARREPTGLSI